MSFEVLFGCGGEEVFFFFNLYLGMGGVFLLFIGCFSEIIGVDKVVGILGCF